MGCRPRRVRARSHRCARHGPPAQPAQDAAAAVGSHAGWAASGQAAAMQQPALTLAELEAEAACLAELAVKASARGLL